MARRLLAFAMTAIILGAPLATAACQASCAFTDATHAEQHSCHGDAAPAGNAVSAPAHACGHVDQLPPGRDEARDQMASPLAIVPAPTADMAVVSLARPAPTRHQYSPPPFVSRSAPLRV
jgi:hypothetical protein